MSSRQTQIFPEMASSSLLEDNCINDFDIEKPLSDLNENILPSKLDVIRHILYYTRHPTTPSNLESTSYAISSKLDTIWRKSKVDILNKYRISEKIRRLHKDYRDYKKARNKTQTEFFKNIKNVFDISSDLLKQLVSSEEKVSLLNLPVTEIAKQINNLQLSNPSGNI